ncbi:hypothetical protein C3942_15445 [Solimonas fluminis]|uniref:Pectate lyase superfamily protein domain-containing protein n=1 Tax=Solimonas fluminis TaxID=2086571 RepID=A0A2S5TDZ8_9GAMM|nr:NosD domain-containing protein [Solimonas fluminis]PPE73209.1 hypothetical protein C3942_15445 [Solimonas fluminis]
MSIGIIKSPRRLVNQLRANLADVANGFGSSMVGFKLDAVSAASRTVYEKLAERVSVKDFGATGDGVTDDTAAIQAAVNFAAGVVGGGTVFLPCGTYKISASIVVPPGVNLKGEQRNMYTDFGYPMLGDGVALEVATAGLGANFIMVKLQGAHNSSVEGISFRTDDFTNTNTVTAISDPDEASGLITVQGNTFERVKNGIVSRGGVCTIWNNFGRDVHGNFIHVLAGAGAFGADNVIAFNSGAGSDNGGIGIAVETGENTIMGNMIFNHQYGIRLDTATTPTSGNRVVGNRCEKHSGASIRIEHPSSRDQLIADNRCFNSVVGIDVRNASRVSISGNHCQNDPATGHAGDMQTGIFVSGANRCAVVDNRVYDARLIGIQIAGSSFSQIHNNHVELSQQQGILLSGSDDCSVEGNMVVSSGQAANDTYDAIFCNNTCDRINLVGNVVRHAGLANKARYALFLQAGGSDHNVVGNDFANATAAATQVVSLGSSGTIMKANRGVPDMEPARAMTGATPSVLDGNLFSTANAGATTITNFLNGQAGQTIRIKVDANTTIQNNANILLAGGVNFVGTANDTITLTNFGSNTWYEVCRSVN